MLNRENQDYFDELKEWSERKLKVLRHYLSGASRILGSTNKVLYYIDGFAGKGTYGSEDETPIAGSPVQAAELALQYEQSHKSYRLSCINIEAKHSRFVGLQSATHRFGPLVTNFKGTFADNADGVLKLVGSDPMICFLDPCGVAGLDWQAVQKVIRRAGKTDLWLRFDSGAVLRRTGWFPKFPDTEAVRQFSVVTTTYGINDPERMYQLLMAGTTPEARKTAALDLYCDRLRNLLHEIKGKGYVASFRIGSLQEQPKYHLVFACANPKGFILASDIVYAVEEEYQLDVERFKQQNPTQLTLFGTNPTPDDIFNAKVTDVAEAIWSVGQGARLSGRALHACILEEKGWFGIIKGKHVREALKQLIADGRITSYTGAVSNDKTFFTFRS
jgi:three-Cys-motif partner protein